MNILDYINRINELYGNHEPRTMDQAALVDELEPGSLKDELLNDFDPSQETYEEYLQRKRLGERPFNMAEGGKVIGKPGGLVEPGVKYYGVYKRQDKPGHEVKWRVLNEKGGVKYSDWLQTKEGKKFKKVYTNKKDALAADRAFHKHVTMDKPGIKKAKWISEGEALAKEFNAKVLKDFEKGNMVDTPSWKSFLEGKKLKHAGAQHYQTKAHLWEVANTHLERKNLANKLITEANDGLKHVDWMDIQRRLVSNKAIDTNTWRSYIDKLDKPKDKANKAFDYIIKNQDFTFETPKNLTKTMQKEGTLLKKIIHDLTGVGKDPIRDGLNMNKNYKKYKKEIQYADRSGLWAESTGKTFKEIMDVAKYRVDGGVSWSYGSSKNLAKSTEGFIFDWGKRHWNYHMKHLTGDSKIKFYWKDKFDANGKPLEIKWNEIPKNKKGYKSINPTEVFFRYKNPETGVWGKNNWSMGSLRIDGLKSGLFNEVYDAKRAYDNLLGKWVTNPFNPEGKKIKFGQLMKKTFKEGFNDLSSSPYSHEHNAKGVKYSGVNELPFNDIKIATQRVNGALNALRSMEGKTINKNVTKLILNELSKDVFDPYSKTFVNDISTAGQKLATSVAEGTIYEPKKTELNIIGEKIIKESKDFTKLPLKTKEGLLHVAGIDWTKPEGRLALKTLTTAQTLNKFLLSKGHKICRGQLVKAAGGGRIGFKGMCGAEFAKNFPEEFINRIGNYPDAAKAVNRANPAVMKNFLNAVAKDAAHPFGWIGGDLVFSTMYSGALEAEGKTPLEALDEGLLWFLPKGVIDAKKKALFGYEGTPSGAFKMEGYAGAYNKDQIADMSAYLDLEEADRKWNENTQELKALNETKDFGQVTSQQIENSRNRLQSNIDEASIAGDTLIKDIYTRNTGLRFEDGKPFKKELSDEEFGNLYQQTQKNLWDVQQKYAIDQINKAKEADLNRLYAQKEGWFDKAMPNITAQWTHGIPIPYLSYEKGFGKRKDGEIHLGELGPVRDIGTFFSNPWDRYRASSPKKASERLPAGIKQGYQKILDLWNMGLISQEKKEQYAKDMGREDLLYKEYNHPIYGPSLSYEQYQRVFPEYFGLASGGRAGYMGGGITGIRKPSAIPPERQGLRSIMLNVNDD